MIGKNLQEEIDEMLHEKLHKIVAEYSDEYAEGWLAGCQWTIQTVNFFFKMEEMKMKYNKKVENGTAKEDTTA